MSGHPLICGRTTFNLDTAFEVRTTPYQGYASSAAEGATLRRAAFRVNGNKRAEWRALANVRKRRKSLGYERQRRIFYNQYRGALSRLTNGFARPSLASCRRLHRGIRPPTPRSEATVCAVTRGNIAELAAINFVALLIALLSVRTIGYTGEQRSDGEGVSQSPLKDKAFSIFLDKNPPFEPRRKTSCWACVEVSLMMCWLSASLPSIVTSPSKREELTQDRIVLRTSRSGHLVACMRLRSQSRKRPFHRCSFRESIGADYPLASLRSFRDRTNARSVAMNRASITGISLLGSLIECPLCAAKISA